MIVLPSGLVFVVVCVVVSNNARPFVLLTSVPLQICFPW